MSALEAKIYKLGSGQFQVSYCNPLNGKRKRNKFASEQAARTHREEIERLYISRDFAHFSDAFVAQLIEQHLKDYPDSRFTERKNMFTSFCNDFGSMKLNALTIPAMKHWFHKIKAENDYSDRTLSSIRSQLNHFFKYLMDQSLTGQNPLDKIRFKRIVAPKRPRIIFSVDEVHQILNNAKIFSPDLLYPFLSCVAHTGARRKEIVRLNRVDVDFATNLIHLKETKNGRERFVRMSPSIGGVMKDHLARHNFEAVLNTDGRRLNSHGELARLMNKFKAFFPMDKADWGSHSLRHSFANNFLKKGGQMYQLQAILGHRSIDVTIDLYGQLQAQDIACPSPYEVMTEEKIK